MDKKEIHEMDKKYEKAIIALMALIIIVQLFNIIQTYSIKKGDFSGTNIQLVSASSVVPTGTPRIYGSELNIRYDDINANDQNKANQAINSLGNLDKTINLEGNDLKRYVKIASKISCEYCCGADSIIFTEDDTKRMNQQINAAIQSGKITEEQALDYRRNAGEAACGCAHSYAMRGVAKYIIKNHGNEFSDDEVLEELAKWKTLFFPSQMESKAKILKENGIEFNYINLGSNKYRGIEQGQAGSGMVGGC